MLATTEWGRDIPWRQGHVLEPKAAEHFSLAHPTYPADTVVVVIGHDCDVANDNLEAEPSVEAIVGRVIAKANGNFTWGKAPKTLHLSIICEGAQIFIELQSLRKCLLPKSELAAFLPDSRYQLSSAGVAVLRSWLGSRYNRAAFPDTFNRRLAESKLDQRISKILAKHGELISFVYFDLAGNEQVELEAEIPYELSIVLVYPPGDDPENTADLADGVASEVDEAINARLIDDKGNRSNNLRLMSCVAISEQDITVSRARLLMHWRLEHMTLRSDADEPGPPAF